MTLYSMWREIHIWHYDTLTAAEDKVVRDVLIGKSWQRSENVEQLSARFTYSDRESGEVIASIIHNQVQRCDCCDNKARIITPDGSTLCSSCWKTPSSKTDQ